MQRIDALEREISQRQSELAAYRAELDRLRAAVTSESDAPSTTDAGRPESPTQTNRTVAADRTAICRLEHRDDLDQAFSDPRTLPECIPVRVRGGGGARPEERLAQTIQQPIPDRPNIAPGLSTTLQFASSTQATVTYTHPVFLRSRFVDTTAAAGERFLGFRPQLLTISGGLTVPVSSGESVLLGITERTNRDDADILPGTTIRLAADFMSFRRFDRANSFLRTVNFLYAAMKTCVKATTGATEIPQTEFYARYGFRRANDRWELSPNYRLPEERSRPCTGANLIDFILATEDDPATSTGTRFVRGALASEYQATFWNETPTAIPIWGWGVSVQYGTSDFKYSQGVVNLVPSATDPTRVVARLDTNSPLAAERTDGEDDWLIQGYASRFLPTRDLNMLPPHGMYSQGILFVGSASYRSTHQFRPGVTGLTICPTAPAGVIARCSVVNVDRPYIREGFTLSGEARLQFNNVPVIGVLGFAPRYSYRLADDRQIIDVPIYLSANSSGFGSAGFRFRHSWDGLDLLGNSERPNTELLVFVTALNFRGF